MVTKEQLQQLTWKNISIVKQSNSTLLIVLFFNTKEEGTVFLRDFLSKEPFKFIISKNKQGEHAFTIQFTSSEYDIMFASKLTTENYPPLTWLNDYKISKFITTGEKGQDGNFLMETVRVPLPQEQIWN